LEFNVFFQHKHGYVRDKLNFSTGLDWCLGGLSDVYHSVISHYLCLIKCDTGMILFILQWHSCSRKTCNMISGAVHWWPVLACLLQVTMCAVWEMVTLVLNVIVAVKKCSGYHVGVV